MLASEALAGLAVEAGGYYVDATFGRGGHTSLLLQALGREGRVLALDRDPQAIAAGRQRFADEMRLTLVHASFADLGTLVPAHAHDRACRGVQFRSLYKFSCVRNPWDRMVSYYFTPTQSPETWDRKKFRKMISKIVSVADYLRLDQDDEDPFTNVDYIMRFENLAEDFRTVCGKVGISAATLPRYNRSNREHYSKYYDDELRELVRTQFAAEIERFGYTFEER